MTGHIPLQLAGGEGIRQVTRIETPPQEDLPQTLPAQPDIAAPTQHPKDAATIPAKALSPC